MEKKLGFTKRVSNFLTKIGMTLKAKLLLILLLLLLIPIVIVTLISLSQFSTLSKIVVNQSELLNHDINQSLIDSSKIITEDIGDALTRLAVESIERMTTDTALDVASFLYQRDDDILTLAKMPFDYDNQFKNIYSFLNVYVNNKSGRILSQGNWELRPNVNAKGGYSWFRTDMPEVSQGTGASSNLENEEYGPWNYRKPDPFLVYHSIPIYDEIAYIDLNGMEQFRITPSGTTKINYPLRNSSNGIDIATINNLKNVSNPINTYVKAENYWTEIDKLGMGEIYVSDVIGAYVRSHIVGIYNEANVREIAGLEFDPHREAFAGMENPLGQRYEGIVRWVTPVDYDSDGTKDGYISMALNHDHIMEFVDHQNPMIERYNELSNAIDGNYAFIWDYNSRSIAHPRHHSIYGFNPETGKPETPWLPEKIYEEMLTAGYTREEWFEYLNPESGEKPYEWFQNQSRSTAPSGVLKAQGLVGLDGRYLNNAPQCIGWMDLTRDGGSGSFYILWSGVTKITTAAAIPYYTGKYAPSEDNDYSRRGFAFVTIGAGLTDFTNPVVLTQEKLDDVISSTNVKLTNSSTLTKTQISKSLTNTSIQLGVSIGIIVILVIFVAVVVASSITSNINTLSIGVGRFRHGERQYRFNPTVKDEFGKLEEAFDEMADSIVDSISQPLTIINMDLSIIYMNNSGLKMMEQNDIDDIIGKNYYLISIYPINTEYDPIYCLIHQKKPLVYFHELTGQYYQGSASYFFDVDGSRLGYIIVSNNITTSIKEQILVENQKALLDQIFMNSPELIWYIDSNSNFLSVNPRFASIVGKTPNELIGQPLTEVLDKTQLEELNMNGEEVLKSKEVFYSECKVTFNDQHVEYLDSVRTPIIDINGNVSGVLGFARNVTSRVKAESELRHTQEELKLAVIEANKANEHKGEFLARMSHEIRTPMNAIIGITSIIKKDINNLLSRDANLENIPKNIEYIEASSKHLLGLLNDILDLSKIDAGKIELVEEVVNLNDLFDEVVNIFSPRCSEKQLEFIREIDIKTSKTFIIDSLRLRQVLLNLLGNSVKFTKELGKIKLTIKEVAHTDNSSTIYFEVADTGIGMTKSVLETLFQPFEQGNANISKEFGGTGLGLAISKKIINLFGGDISVETKVGKGSKFMFTIELTFAKQVIEEKEVITDINDSLVGKRCLLVDDVEMNRLIVVSLLEETGLIIEEAGDGEDAVNMFKDSKVNYYDIILMDIRMPKVNGYEATTQIRELKRRDAKSIPIVALTANTFKDDIDAASAAGMNSHLAKPIEFDKLMSVLFKYLKKK